jgi:endonuclease G, mitochondrial
MKILRQILLLIALVNPLSAFALFEDCKDLFPSQQIPSTSQTGRDLCFDSFAIYYSPQDKKPIYTVEKLSREQLLAPHPRRSNQFYEEARLPFSERSLLSDYRGSGYDRGHNVPAGDMSNERAMAQSFSLANMMPQARQNNQGIWAKNVEEPTRLYVKRTVGDVFVFTGSTGNSGSIGKGQVTIPSHLYKLVYDPNKNRAWAYWVENTNEASMSPPITYQDLMQKTGIDFHLPVHGESNSPHQAPIKPKLNKSLVGGWYPVFFDDVAPAKMDQLIKSTQEGRVASIQIQYDRNSDLAKKIAAQVQSQTSIIPSLLQSSPPDSPTVTYERNRVTLIVRSK